MRKLGKKIWMNIYSKPTDSKCYVSYLSNHLKSCLKNIPFCLARCICMKAENVRYMKLKELRPKLKTQQYPKMVVENREFKKLSKFPRSNLDVENCKITAISYHLYLHLIIIIQTCFRNVREIYGNLQISKTLGKIFAKHI